MDVEGNSIPAQLFKYQPLTPLSIGNLASSAIYCCSPAQFNDPFDCAVTAKLRPLTQREVQAIKADHLKNYSSDSLEAKELEHIGRLSLGRMIDSHMTNFLENERQKLLKTVGVACFTEVHDSALMWSHYADCGKGYCLEFRTDTEFFAKAKKVRYRESFPELDGYKLMMELDADELYELLRTKSHHWRYEKEWRVLKNGAGTTCTYGPDDLVGIYVGPRMERGSANAIGCIVRALHPNAKFFTAHPSAIDFKIEFAAATFSAERSSPVP